MPEIYFGPENWTAAQVLEMYDGNAVAPDKNNSIPDENLARFDPVFGDIEQKVTEDSVDITFLNFDGATIRVPKGGAATFVVHGVRVVAKSTQV